MAMAPITQTLQKELAYFEAHKSELLANHRGKFALIHDSELLGTFDHFQEAFEVGVQKLGNQPFLIQPVADEPIMAQVPALAVGVISAHT